MFLFSGGNTILNDVGALYVIASVAWQSPGRDTISKLQGITQAVASNRKTPTLYAYTRIRSCKRIGHQYEYTQSHQRRYAAMFFYAAIVLCASTRQNGIKKHHRLCAMALVGLSRLVLPPSRLSGACSNQLSYNPILVEVSGFEPLTPCLQSRCSTN